MIIDRILISINVLVLGNFQLNNFDFDFFHEYFSNYLHKYDCQCIESSSQNAPSVIMCDSVELQVIVKLCRGAFSEGEKEEC